MIVITLAVIGKRIPIITYDAVIFKIAAHQKSWLFPVIPTRRASRLDQSEMARMTRTGNLTTSCSPNHLPVPQTPNQSLSVEG